MLQPLGLVYLGANDGVVPQILSSQISDRQLAGVDADSDQVRLLPLTHPLGIQFSHLLLHGQAGTDRIGRVALGALLFLFLPIHVPFGISEKGHDAVTHIFIKGTPVIAQNGGHGGEVFS